MLWRSLIVGVFCLSMLACAEEKGRDMYEIARQEDRQGNTAHATKLYNNVISAYPGSKLAKKAEERIAEMSKAK